MLQLITTEELYRITSPRTGETKLGEKLKLVPSLDALIREAPSFVLFGIEEDIGIRANLGVAGAAEAWAEVIPALANMQHNHFWPQRQVIVLGALRYPELMQKAAALDPARPEDLQALRSFTATIDAEVSDVVRQICQAGHTPVAVGGGHNNAYGLIRGVSTAISAPLSVLNIDPHTDYRTAEGRHSGNGFRYARQEKYLGRYAVWGLHENYNSTNILAEFDRDPELQYLSFEEWLWLTPVEQQQRLENVLHWLGAGPCGLELDMDSLQHFPVSALNPSGFSFNDLRRIVRFVAQHKRPRYFHLPEASPCRAATPKERQLTGKSLAYLISDFIKCCEIGG